MAAGCWLLGAACWLLAAGCWVLGDGCWLMAADYCLLLLAASCWLLADGLPQYKSCDQYRSNSGQSGYQSSANNAKKHRFLVPEMGTENTCQSAPP